MAIQQYTVRGASGTEWATTNPVLGANEIGFVLETGAYKVGPGNWNTLDYVTTSAGAIQQIQLRRGSTTEWTSADPVLAAGEPGHTVDSGDLRVGDGSRPWSALPSVSPMLDLRAQPGVVGDGTTNDAAALNAALSSAASLGVRAFARGEFRINSTVTITASADLSGAVFRYYGTGTAVQIGAGPIVFRQDIAAPQVTYANKPATGWTTGTQGIRVVNANTCNLYIPWVQGFEDGLVMYGQGAGSVHNTVTLGHLDNNKRNLVHDSDATGWSNSIEYTGGKLSHQSAEGTLIPGTRHILLKNTPNEPNGNLWENTSVEGNVAEQMVDVDGGSYNEFYNLRWESSLGGRVRWGATSQYNTVRAGYSMQNIVVTRVPGEVRNVIQNQSVFELFGSSTEGMLRMRNSSSDAYPAAVLYGTAGTDAGQWAWRVSAQKMEGKRTTDPAPRTVVDYQNSRFYLGSGAAAPSMYFGTVGTSGIAMTAGNFYLSPDNAHDIGLATAFRPRDVNAARYVRVGTIILRDNGGVLERSTNGTTWTAV